MRKFFLPLIALVVGFCLAFLAAGVSSYFFVLLPILAFAFGYFSSWRLGLLCSLLLFGSYTFAISLVWWGNHSNLFTPLPYIAAFITGGIGILLIGVLSPMVRKSIKRAVSILALVILAGMIGLCAYSAMPHYGYYYQVAIESSEDLSNLEIFLPVGTVSGESYEQLYDKVYSMPEYLTRHLSGHLTGDFTHEVVDTEQGKMLKITIPELTKDDAPCAQIYSKYYLLVEKRA